MTAGTHTVPDPAADGHEHRPQHFGPRSASCDVSMASAPEPCDNCDATAVERCATCGSCRCDQHTYCGPTVPAAVRAAALALAPDHTAATINAYGACSRAGYAVNPVADGRARIHHRFPTLNVLDPNRLSQDQRWTVARRKANAYALTLETAGWTVEHKTVTTGTILLAAPPPTIDQIRETLGRAVEALHGDGQTLVPAAAAGPLADLLDTVTEETHGPAPQPGTADSSCHGCGGTGQVYLGTGPDGHAWSDTECCCSHRHCTCGSCDGFPCARARSAYDVALGLLSAAPGCPTTTPETCR
jgi:hypothetical protein